MSRELIGKLVQAVNQRRDEWAVGDALRHIHDAFGGHISAFSVLAKAELTIVRGAPPERVDQYRNDEFGQAGDPLAEYAFRRRGPVHDQQVFTADEWNDHPFVVANSKRFGSGHYLVVPVMNMDGVMGLLHVSRRRGHRCFTADEHHRAAMVSAHLSVAFERRWAEIPTLPRLTHRERQVGIMAAQGHDNPAIALALGLQRETVKKTLGRLYAKLGVKGRPQMAATLASHGLVPGSGR